MREKEREREAREKGGECLRNEKKRERRNKIFL
jgi:hypothetical protein